jgi:hypothetical protein
MQHMYGHADEYLLEAEMSPAQRVNCQADKLVTAALIATVEVNEFIWGKGYGVPQKCNHRALGRTGGASTV